MGQVVAENLADASKKNPEESEEEASIIYQKMKSKSEDVPDSCYETGVRQGKNPINQHA